MPYTKTAWVDGSAPAITAAQMNRIETGIDDAHADDSVTTAKLQDGVVTAEKLDPQAIGVDPVFGPDDTAGTSLAGNGVSVIPAGCWVAYVASDNLCIEAFVNGAWRKVMQNALEARLVISDGTNMRIKNVAPFTIYRYYRRRVYP